MCKGCIAVMCVDDNTLVTDALGAKLALEPDMRWVGDLPDACRLVEEVERRHPDVVLLDVDMPGRDPFQALEELSGSRQPPRVIMFSGHLRSDLVDRAVEAGAWGYVSKNEGSDAIVSAIRKVVAGEFVLVPDVEAEYGRHE